MKLHEHKFLTLAAAGVLVAVGVAAIPNGPARVGASGPDLMSLLRARSPGSRTAGALTNKSVPVQTAALATRGPGAKRAPVAAAAPLPEVAAASPPVTIPYDAPVFTPPPPAVLAPAAGAVVPVAVAAAPAGIGGGVLLPLVPAIVAVGGGGGGGGSPEPAPAIPEPATWLMMIAGFGILGSALRRRRRFERDRITDGVSTSAVVVRQG